METYLGSASYKIISLSSDQCKRLTSKNSCNTQLDLILSYNPVNNFRDLQLGYNIYLEVDYFTNNLQFQRFIAMKLPSFISC